MSNPTAAMLVIGDEILSGRTRDSNMYYLAQELDKVGIDLNEVRVVSDNAEQIAGAVNELRRNHAHVFTSGGIGPTHDDITADSVAAAFDVSININEEAKKMLEANYSGGAADLNASRLRMARIPDGATLIDNPVSRAPGFSLQNVHVMAGVPKIFAAMLEGLLATLSAGKPLSSTTISILMPEGEIVGPLALIANEFPGVSIGSYPFYSNAGLGSNIVIRGSDADLVKQVSAEVTRVFGAALK